MRDRQKSKKERGRGRDREGRREKEGRDGYTRREKRKGDRASIYVCVSACKKGEGQRSVKDGKENREKGILKMLKVKRLRPKIKKKQQF